MNKCLNISRRLKARLMLSVFVLMILLSIVFNNLPGGTTPFPIRTAWAEEENPDEWNNPEDPDDWEGWGDPNFFDQESIPFHLVNVPGKTPGIDLDSEWKLELKEEWEDRDLPNRVTSVAMNLYCFDMDWKDNWSHVWKKEVQGLPETLPCAGPKIAGRYKLTAVVRYDDTFTEVSVGFTIEGEGYERITSILSQAATENKTNDEWQTAFNLYNWLLNRLVYDSTLSYYSSDAILRGTGVCDSYARLYCLLCRAAGLNAYVIYGDTWQGYHAWDAVQINGEWYYADPTWDDHPVNDPAMDTSQPTADENGTPYGVSDYQYFMLNKRLMTINNHKTYEWLDENKFMCDELPATSLAAYYYVHTGLVNQWGTGTGDDFRTVQDLVRGAFISGEKMWSSLSLNQVPIYTSGSPASPFLLTHTELFALGWGLKGVSITLPDGKAVTLDTYVYERPDKSGWVLNVYPEGSPETDEPGRFELPQNLTHIEAQAFENDPHCGEVICPSSLKSIGSRAFANCSRLWSIRIPSDVQSIADDAFDGCGEFCIWTEHRDSLPARYATEHNITLFVDDEEEGSNG